MDGREEKTVTITMRVRPSLKAAAEVRAQEDGRSLTNYVERLIEADVAKVKPRGGKASKASKS